MFEIRTQNPSAGVVHVLSVCLSVCLAKGREGEGRESREVSVSKRKIIRERKIKLYSTRVEHVNIFGIP